MLFKRLFGCICWKDKQILDDFVNFLDKRYIWQMMKKRIQTKAVCYVCDKIFDRNAKNLFKVRGYCHYSVCRIRYKGDSYIMIIQLSYQYQKL